MIARRTSILTVSLLLTAPVIASTAFATTVRPSTHRHHQVSPHTVAARCGMVAGHAGHTRLAAPAAVPCSKSPSSVAHLRPASASAALPHASVSTPLRRHAGMLPASHAHLSTVAADVTAPRPAHAIPASLTHLRFVPPLRGSRASLLRQNERDTAEGLERIQDETQLDTLEASRQLVPVPTSVGLRINPDLPLNRRDCRPWTARFLSDLARVHYARYGRSLQVNSAVRTVAFQRALMEINGNAAAADGDMASPHLTGAAIDIGKKGLSVSEIAWMRAWLLPLQTAGKIDVEEEFYQACFHITVYRSYAPPAAPRAIPHRRRSTTTLLAAGIR